MGIEIDTSSTRGGKGKQMRNGIEVKERLYKTEDGEIVREGDPRAATLYRGIGQKISLEEAAELGLIDGGEVSESTAFEVKEGNTIKEASNEGLVDILIGTVTEFKERELDLDDVELTAEQKTALAHLFAEEEGEIDVPDGVEAGETAGWPLDAATGELLNLRPEQRTALAEKGISGVVTADDVEDLIEGKVGQEEDLEQLGLKELKEIAVEAGVEDAEKLRSKAKAVEAIKAKRAEASGE